MNKPAAPLLVTFALPDESRSFLRTLTSPARLLPRARPPALPTWVGHQGDHLVSVVHTGVGDTPQGRERLQAMLATAENPRYVLSAGYAGGLSPRLRVGDLILGENHSDPALLAAARRILSDAPPHVGSLVTTDSAAETVAAKSALARATGALAVDMETQWIGNVCARAGVPLLSLRVISDAADQSFPVSGHVLFDAARQRPRYLALPFHLLLHPLRIPPFVRFVQALPTARARLTRALATLLSDL